MRTWTWRRTESRSMLPYLKGVSGAGSAGETNIDPIEEQFCKVGRNTRKVE